MSRDIPLLLIDPDPEQPRKHFEQSALNELAQSMGANGLAQAILLRPTGERYIIVHGERRYRAAKQLGWQSIPAEVRNLNVEEARWLALIENIQRSDLSPIEEAKAYQWHLDQGVTQTALGERIGKSQSYIAQKLRLLKMPKALQYYLDQGGITEGHARQLLRFKSLYMDFGHHSFKGVETPVFPDDFPDDSKELSTWIAFWLNGIRPMDRPALFWFKDSAEFAMHVGAFTELFAEGKEDDWVYPAWSIAAYWYAALVVNSGTSVADLKSAIDNWQAIMYSNIVWTHLYPKATENMSREEREHWYMARADLRHAGLAFPPSETPKDLLLAALQFTSARDGYHFPTNMQPGGKHEEAALTLMQQTE